MRYLMILAVCTLSFSTWAQAKPAMNYGFEELNSPAVPNEVKTNSQFIYRVDIPFFTATSKAAYDDLLALPNFPASAKKDIERCRLAGLEKCIIHFGSMRGSAFLDTSGDAVWTNCHIVHGWISYARQSVLMAGRQDVLNELRQSEIPLTLRNSAGELQDFGTARLEAFVAVGLRNQAELECSLANDAVKLKLSRRLAARGIPRAKKITPEENLYIAGFPRKTSSRAALGAKDSDGEAFYWTRGSHLPRGNAVKEFFGSEEPLGLLLGGPDAEVVLADGIEGMSGGPVMNERGEVVGLYKGYLPIQGGDKETPLASIIFAGLRFVEIFSEGF